jgi:hypothetical protein
VYILAFIYRIHYIDEHWTCVIGNGRKALTPIVVIDMIMNIWLTGLFVQPIFAISKQPSSRTSHVLRKVAQRTLIGVIVALLACFANFISLFITQGEKAWICLLVCNLESMCSRFILFEP